MKLNIFGAQPIIAPRDPVQLMEVATKNYVDTSINLHSQDETIHITPAQNVWLDSITVSAEEINALAGVGTSLQNQLDAKVAKAGDVMTGALTLSGQPTENLHAATKSYVDNSSATRVSKSGDTMTGALTLSGAPTNNLHAATKEYVDTEIVSHANNEDLHLTAAQNLWIDSITVTADEINHLGGVTSGVQEQINTKFDKTGGTITGDVTLAAGKGVFVSKLPSSDTELVNKAYVDAKVQGQEWKDPVSDINLVSTAVNSVGELGDGAVGIVGSSAVGELAALVGHAVYVDDLGQVVSIKGAPVTVGDRFAVALKTETLPSGDLSTHKGKIVTITDATPSAIQFSIEVATAGTTVLVFDEQSVHFGETYSYTDEGVWVLTNRSVNLNAGSGLNITGKTIDVQLGKGLTLVNNDVTVNTGTGSALNVSTGQLELKVKDTTITQDQDGIRVSSEVMSNIDDRLSKSTGGTVEGAVSFSTTSSLNLGFTASEPSHAVTKQYVDAADTAIQTQVNTISGKVAVLEQDPTTKAYVDAQDGLKVSKAGDTMTGFLTLHAAPSTELHAATKQYVDSGLTAHVTDETLHLTSAQNLWIDAITVTADEVNHLAGATGNVQDQLDAKLNLSGGTLTGAIQLHADPSLALEAATKQYVDNKDALKVSKAGDTLTGALVLHADPVNDLEASTKQYVDTSVSTANSTLTTAIGTKVSKAGDTMTGPLVLPADPTNALEATTKQYVDSASASTKLYIDTQDQGIQNQVNALADSVSVLEQDPVTKTYVDDELATKVAKSGDSMTGYLTLHADPQQSMHAVTKQYVDAIAQGLSTKPSVRLATTTNLAANYNNGTQGVNSTLTGVTNGALVVDGVTPLVGDRVLVKAQTNKAENGDYVVQQVGSAVTPFILKRATTIDESHEVPGSYFYVFDGSDLKGTGWVFTVDNPITFSIGLNDINVHQFSGQGSIIAGGGLSLEGNTLAVVSANVTRIVVTQDSIDLAVTGVTPGSYTKVTVDGYGRVLTASNPTTLAGYGISDAQPLNLNLTNLSGVSTQGLLVRDATDNIATRKLAVSGVGLSIANEAGGSTGDITITSNATSLATANTVVSRDANGDFSANQITAALVGNASTATTLQNSRDFSITGDVVASAQTFNGASNVTLTTELTETGVAAGTYTKVEVDAKGRVISATAPTSIADLLINDVYTKQEVQAIVSELEKKIAELHLYVMGRI